MGLTQKILLFTSLMIVALVGTTLAFTTVQADRLARTTIQEALSETRGVWESYQADRFNNLKARLGALANDPYLKPLVEAAVEGEAGSLANTLEERAADIRPDLFLATDPLGVVVARADGQPGGQDLSADPLLSAAIEQGKAASTLWRQGPRLYHAVSAPMVTDGDTKGVLVAGYEINQALAEQLRKITHCEVAFLSEGSGQAAQLAASSLGTRAAGLLPGLSATAGAGEMAPFNLDLGGERYVAVQAPLEDASGHVLGRVVAMRSLAREMAGFLQFRNSLVLVSLGVMAVALLLATLGARRITGPMRTLVSLVERARDGSYTGVVSVQSGDEIGVLARTFNSLMAELREKEQLIQFLNEGMTQMKRTGEAQPTVSSNDETAAIRAVSAQAGVQVEKGQLFAGRYEILGTLGKGGMGIVYRAEDKRLDEVVALKVLRPEVLLNDSTLLQRFKEELRLARRITHKNVLRTHDFDVTQDGTPYISMEYLEGVTLKDLIQGKGALPAGVGLRVSKQMCAGLNAAHQQGVVHRDIKPHNMLILPETGELKIMDFGIARRSEMQAEGGLTSDGMVMGTPDYMAPEQAQGHPADFRSDIYALGVVLFEIFTGRLPFQGDTLMATVLKHIQEPPPDPRQVNPRLAVDLAQVILRCLEKDPARRFQRAADIHKELTAASARLGAAPAAA